MASGEEERVVLVVRAVAAQKHQMFEIVGESAALAVHLVATAGVDDHPQCDDLRLGVGHDEDVVGDLRFKGGPRAAGSRDGENCQDERGENFRNQIFPPFVYHLGFNSL